MDWRKSWEHFEALRKKSIQDWQHLVEELREQGLDAVEHQLKERFGWLWQRYQPAKLLTAVGLFLVLVGILGASISVAALYQILFAHTSIWELLAKNRFEFMVAVVRLLLCFWIILTGFGIITRRRWAGVSCMIGYLLVQSQSVYVMEHFWLSVLLSGGSFALCVVLQLHWETLMVGVQEDLPLECNHQKLRERAQGFNYWGYFVYCPGCQKRVFFWDNILAPFLLLCFSIGWAAWWYWPFWPVG